MLQQETCQMCAKSLILIPLNHRLCLFSTFSITMKIQWLKVYSKNLIILVELSKSILKVCPIIGSDLSKELILPHFLTLLNDKNNDVRLNLVKNLGEILSVLPIENYIKMVIQVVDSLMSDTNWRNRKRNIASFSLIAKNIVHYFIEIRNLILFPKFSSSTLLLLYLTKSMK